MSTPRSLLSLLAVLALAACAGSPPSANQLADAPKAECERSYSTGSMVPKKDCAPPMTEQERQQMQAEMAARVRQSSPPPPGK